MCLVGNGFDIGALYWLYDRAPELKLLGSSELIKGKYTSYRHFYEYISISVERSNLFQDNLVFKEMEERNKKTKGDDYSWAEF